jgi:hypothetical protein
MSPLCFAVSMMGRMTSLNTMPGMWEADVAEVMGRPWILMELEWRD